MTSSPGQVLDHQKVRHPAKDHSHLKEDQVADDIYGSVISGMMRDRKRCYFTQRAEESWLSLCDKHMYAYVERMAL